MRAEEPEIGTIRPFDEAGPHPGEITITQAEHQAVLNAGASGRAAYDLVMNLRRRAELGKGQRQRKKFRTQGVMPVAPRSGSCLPKSLRKGKKADGQQRRSPKAD